MFGEKNSAAIYLERNSIVFADPEKQILETLSLESELINHLEIKNTEKFIQVVKTFLEQFLKESAVIFLSKPIIFEREIENDNKEATDPISPVEKFLSMVPIAKSKLGSKVLVNDNSSLCLATNGEYYQLVFKSAELSGIKISAVVPAFLFNGLEDANGLVAEMVHDALNDSDRITTTNFIDKKAGAIVSEGKSELEIEENDTSVETSRSKTKTIVLTIVLIALLSFSLIFSYVNGLFDKFLPAKTADITQIVQTVPTVSDSENASQSGQPSPSPVAFANLRASIKNGTGISGQAAKAKELLDELELQEVLIATDSAKGTDITSLEYDPIVPEELVMQVKTALETVFAEVEDKEATNTGEFDFIVITGRE